jgi:hypothetical protein
MNEFTHWKNNSDNNYEMGFAVAINEQGFAMLGNLKNVRPEPMPN